MKRLVSAAAIAALCAGCKSPTAADDPELDYFARVEGIALTANGAPLDSVRILPIGAADDAIYSFVQVLTDQEGHFAVTVWRKGTVGGSAKLELTINVIATAFKGYNLNPDGPFPTQHLRVPVEFVPTDQAPPTAHVEIKF